MSINEEFEKIKNNLTSILASSSITFLKTVITGLLAHIEELEKKIKEFENSHK